MLWGLAGGPQPLPLASCSRSSTPAEPPRHSCRAALQVYISCNRWFRNVLCRWLLTRPMRRQAAACKHVNMPLQTWPTPRRRGLCGTSPVWTPSAQRGLLRHSSQLQRARLRPCSAQVRPCTCVGSIVLPERAEHTASRLPCIVKAVDELMKYLLPHVVRQQSNRATNRHSQRRTSLTR